MRNWINHPTRKNLFTILTVLIIGNILITIAITDLFTERFFNKKYILIYSLMLISTGTTLKVIINYFNTRRTEGKKIQMPI